MPATSLGDLDDLHDVEDLAAWVARFADDNRLTVAVAESLTSGAVAQALGAAEGAARWFRGGLVAYSTESKALLGVPAGPVMTAECAAQMALGTRSLLDADVTVGITGVGGPDPEEDRAPGTVFAVAAGPCDLRLLALSLPGGPGEVIAESTRQAVRLLGECLRDLLQPADDTAPVPRVASRL